MKSSHTIVKHLKASLSRTLEFFPPLVGRLGIANGGDGETSFFIDCNNAGALFAHAVADVTISDMLEPLYVPSVLRHFFLLNGIYNHEAISQPVLAVQVTELVDGFFIGCTMNHVISDATAFWLFFESWSEISRGCSKNLCELQVLRRWFPNDINFPIRLTIPLTKLMEDKYIFPPLEERIFHFSKEKILALKVRDNAQMSSASMSSFQALLAHVWRGVVRCRGTGVDQRVKCVLGINTRRRLQPSLPETYFGSAVIFYTIATTAGELLNNSLGWAAWEMKKVIMRQTDSGVRSFLKVWSENPTLLSFQNNDIIIGNSPQFNFFNIDFGWGNPLMARSGSAQKTDGSIVLYCGEEEGSIDISVCLLPENLHALGKDDEFMEAVTRQDMKLLVSKHVAKRSSL